VGPRRFAKAARCQSFIFFLGGFNLLIHFVHVLNGLVAFDATDNDPMGAKDGLIGLQAHVGPPNIAQFKDIVIRPLTSFPTDIGKRFVSHPGPAPEPARVLLNIKMENVPQ